VTTLSKDFSEFASTLPSGIKLVVISKTRPVNDILDIYDSGHRVFGENKVQELLSKAPLLPDDIEWHLVGHLQTNKVKYIAPFVHLIHSVDSLKLLIQIDKEAFKNKRIIDCLLQIHIAEEESKFGFSALEAYKLLDDDELKSLKNIRICGLMGMATFTDNEVQIRKEFKNLAAIFKNMKEKYFQDKHYFTEISMGMSGDYNIAIEEGASIIRIGSLIFGERNYL
jgi:PLP dependent protein